MNGHELLREASNALRGCAENLRESEVIIARLERQRLALALALEDLLERYTGLVNCGDCGSWDCEKEDEVIAACAALAEQSA